MKEEWITCKEISRRLNVNVFTIKNWKREFKWKAKAAHEFRRVLQRKKVKLLNWHEVLKHIRKLNEKKEYEGI